LFKEKVKVFNSLSTPLLKNSYLVCCFQDTWLKE